ncbi:diaminopimelate epimerase [Candidatus Woesearchaeota archaeon]|nr:diaminopimelate epimerase [Candidatus Woesearchaeota archaeon]
MLKFTKMQGLGNDFVVVDAVRQLVDLNPEQVRRLADRHFGIGCDQVLLVVAPPDDSVDFGYRIFNADGSEVAQCGNGARCFARFVREHGLCEKDEIRVMTAAGRMVLYHRPDDNVCVDMGIPRHEPIAIPVQAPCEQARYTLTIDGIPYHFGAVSLGNPHAVLQVDDIDTAPVENLGGLLESHPFFPERANIGFFQPSSPHHARLRVYERGAGETLACGSGACAAAVVGIEHQVLQSPVTMTLPGGSLLIEWAGRGRPVLMTGLALTVFEGQISL